MDKITNTYNVKQEMSLNYKEKKQQAVPKKRTNVKFLIGYMESNEQKAMEESNTIGCWYCGIVGCCLTHKGDKYEKAKYPERNPYIGNRY